MCVRCYRSPRRVGPVQEAREELDHNTGTDRFFDFQTDFAFRKQKEKIQIQRAELLIENQGLDLAASETCCSQCLCSCNMPVLSLDFNFQTSLSKTCSQ